MHMNDEQRSAELRRAVGLYTRLVYGIALHELNGGSRADADDVFQEVFLLYFRRLGDLEFGCEEERRAWLARTAVNLSRRYRLSIWNTRVEKLPPDDLPERAEDIFTNERERAVFSAVKALPERYRLPVYLYYFENMPAGEVARVLRISEGAVLTRLHRARKRLRKQLEGEYFDE